MLQLSGEKMSKSIGNLVTIEDFLANHPADACVCWCLTQVIATLSHTLRRSSSKQKRDRAFTLGFETSLARSQGALQLRSNQWQSKWNHAKQFLLNPWMMISTHPLHWPGCTNSYVWSIKHARMEH
jgi:cysteinyl-tRNA synthetase